MSTVVAAEQSAVWSGARLVQLNKYARQMFQELSQVRGVQGACLADNHGTILGMLLAGAGERRMFEQIALALTQCLVPVGARSGIQDVELHFERKLIVTRDLGNALLVMVCSPEVNLPLLRMTLNVAASPFAADPEMQRGLKQGALSRAFTVGQDRLDASARGLLQKAEGRPS